VRLSQLLVLLLALCALLAEAAAGDLDYWKILGLRRGASEADIKKSYRKLSKKFHPDKNKSEDAEQRFVEVSQGAYRHSEWVSNDGSSLCEFIFISL